jgi:hypothetical protein
MVKSKVQLFITAKTKEQGSSKVRLQKEILVKVHFSFILLLALSTIIDFHVKLCCANMVVESHEEALMEVMVFYKLRPATFEVLLTGAIVPNLHFIWSSSTRLFTKNRFSQFPSIHEFGKIQRQMLNLMALCIGDAKERKYPGRNRRSTRRIILATGWAWSTWTWSSAHNFWFILATG